MTRVQILHRKTAAPVQQIQIMSTALGQAPFVASVSHYTSNDLNINPKHKSTNSCGFIPHKSFCN